MERKTGFTLIEIMVSLVLVGIIASMAATTVLTGLKGYLFARENDILTQKAQLAITRLERELLEIIDVPAPMDSSRPYLIYESPHGRRAIAKVGDTVRIFFSVPGSSLPSDSQGDVLVDQVNSLTIAYNPLSVTPWNYGDNIQKLYAVKVDLVLSRPESSDTVTFTTTVSPRNNNNTGGADLPTINNPPPAYAAKQCFVATAACGRTDHPAVVILREFRDRVLLSSSIGESLVAFYYDVGPGLAAAIQDRPLARLVALTLILPLAGIALLILYFPAAIPVVLVLSWFAARLLIAIWRRESIRHTRQLLHQRGAVLVTVIAAIVVFATLSAAMLAMFTSSSLSQVAGNNSMKAYYLAESGLRYAASVYVNQPDEASRDTKLAAMHDQEYTFFVDTAQTTSDGRFQLHVYPYYYRVKNIESNKQWLDTEVLGGYPLNSSDYTNGSWIQIAKKSDGSIVYERILGASLIFPNTVQFTRYTGTWDASITSGSEVTPACLPDPARLTVTDPDADGLRHLAFQANTGAAAFPPRNGVVTVKDTTGRVRTLAYRELDLAYSRLKGVSDPNGISVAGLTVASSNNYIASGKFVRIVSMGVAPPFISPTVRRITYYAPIGYVRADTGPRPEFKDTMDSLANWYTGTQMSRVGTLQASTIVEGGYALNMGSGQIIRGGGVASCLNYLESQIGLNWNQAGIPMQEQWWQGGRFLSYDIQVKLKTDILAPPVPTPPYTFAAGPSFRLDESGNTYGLSIGYLDCGLDGLSCDKDKIPDNLEPSTYDTQAYLLLWMKQFSKTYGFAIGDVAWSPHVGPPSTSPSDPPPAGTGTRVLAAGSSFNWMNGTRVRLTNSGGALPSPAVEGQDYYIRVISYTGFKYVYLFDTSDHAICTGCVSGTYWVGLVNLTNQGTGMHTLIAQEPVWTNLAAETLVSSGIDKYGILKSPPYGLPKDWTTFLVRILEAPSLSFRNGGISGREILSRDTLYQTNSGLPNGTVTAIARAKKSPLYASHYLSDISRNWLYGLATGVIILEIVKDSDGKIRPYAFAADAPLFVGDPPDGQNVATVGAAGQDAFRDRDNWIEILVGDPQGRGSADTDPFDTNRSAVTRNQFVWPNDEPVDTTVVEDLFTIVHFPQAALNSAYVKGFYSYRNYWPGLPDMLRVTSPDGTTFYSPQTGTSFPTARAEVGLHAYGSMIPNTDFDDFALRFFTNVGAPRQGFMMPVQQ